MKVYRDISDSLLLCAIKNFLLLFKSCGILSVFLFENNKMLHVTYVLPCTKCSEIFLIGANLHNSVKKKTLLSSPFYNEETGSERFGKLPKASQPGG